jgi:tetratricopeptide (TPR) repeat protein
MNEQTIQKLMDEQKYDEALKLLLQKDKHYLSKVQCLYELGKYQELTDYFKEIKDQIETDYYEILGLHLLSLMELHEYDEALRLLNEELAMPYVESDYLEVMNNLYDEIVARKQIYLVENDMYHDALTEESIKDILADEHDFDMVLNVIMRLDDFNIRNLIDSIKTFLADEKRNDILKSFILELLIKQQINEDVVVKKNGYEYQFRPIASEMVKQNHHYLQTSQKLSDHLEKNPSLLSMCLDVLDLVAYSIYPEMIAEAEVNLYAGAIEYYVTSLNYEDLTDDFIEYYQSDEASIETKVEQLVALLNKSEEN